jgi:hypothetical protein
MSTPEQKVEADITKVKAWWKEFPVYGGMIAGAILALVVRHFI